MFRCTSTFLYRFPALPVFSSVLQSAASLWTSLTMHIYWFQTASHKSKHLLISTPSTAISSFYSAPAITTRTFWIWRRTSWRHLHDTLQEISQTCWCLSNKNIRRLDWKLRKLSSRTLNVEGSARKVRTFKSPQIIPSTLKKAADPHKTLAHIYRTTWRRIPQDVSLIFPAVENSDLIVPEITSLNYTRSETRL